MSIEHNEDCSMFGEDCGSPIGRPMLDIHARAIYDHWVSVSKERAIRHIIFLRNEGGDQFCCEEEDIHAEYYNTQSMDTLAVVILRLREWLGLDNSEWIGFDSTPADRARMLEEGASTNKGTTQEE